MLLIKIKLKYNKKYILLKFNIKNKVYFKLYKKYYLLGKLLKK